MITRCVCTFLGCVLLLAAAGCQEFIQLTNGNDAKFTSADVTMGGAWSRGGGAWTMAPPMDAENPTLAPSQTSPTPEVAREIEEADVVKLIGDRLYVLNPFRGLRIIDVADWSKPALKGAVAFTGSPLEMYVANNVAVIITQNYALCRLDGAAQPVKQPVTRIYLIEVSSVDAPSLVNTFDVDGYVGESRRVGDVIYVAGTLTLPVDASVSDVAMPSEAADGFVASIYVADPQNVCLVELKTLPKMGQFIHATSSAIFVTGFDWETAETTVQYVDISDPAGKIVLRGVCRVPGQIRDRFSLSAHEDVLRVVAHRERWWMPWSWNTETSVPLKEGEPDYGIRLYTFTIADPDNVTALGDLFIIKDESLQAVRFDGLKAYVVTFERRDPLWVVDLADPARPAISGYLEAPGYSTYLESDGARLVAVGFNDVDDWRACVMLYDVADPAAPRELDRYVLGEQYSSSEANYDEKAFKVLADAKLILVPYDDWSRNGYRNLLQMVDYSGDNLTALAAVEHRGTAIRSGADLAGNILWILSPQALQTLDIADRQAPRQLALLPVAEDVLAWKRVGQYGLRMVMANERYGNLSVDVQVLAAGDPNGADVLASRTIQVNMPQLLVINDTLAVVFGVDDQGQVKVVTLNIAELPALTVAAEKTFGFRLHYAGWYGYGGYSEVSPDAAASRFYMPAESLWQGDQANPLILENGGLVFITPSEELNAYAYMLQKELKIVTLADPANPALAAEVSLADGEYDVVMQVGVSGNTVFSTIGTVNPSSIIDILTGRADRPTIRLDARLVDCSNPASPMAGDRINVPGVTVGLRGHYVFTVDPQWSDNGIITRFCSSRISGREADLVKMVDLPEGTPRDIHFVGNAAIGIVGGSYGYYGPVFSTTVAGPAAKRDECQMGTFNLVSIDVTDPANITLATNDPYAGSVRVVGTTEPFVVGQTWMSSQGLIWRLDDKQALTLNRVVDLPSTAADVNVTSGAIDFVCGPGGVISVSP